MTGDRQDPCGRSVTWDVRADVCRTSHGRPSCTACLGRHQLVRPGQRWAGGKVPWSDGRPRAVRGWSVRRSTCKHGPVRSTFVAPGHRPPIGSRPRRSRHFNAPLSGPHSGLHARRGRRQMGSGEQAENFAPRSGRAMPPRKLGKFGPFAFLLKAFHVGRGFPSPGARPARRPRRSTVSAWSIPDDEGSRLEVGVGNRSKLN